MHKRNNKPGLIYMSNELEFNLPDFVAGADSSQFDASVPGSFSVGGYRLDNRAAVWVAAADMRKNASEMGHHLQHLIKQACELFDVTDDMFMVKEAGADPATITLTDGTNIASFCILDKESLDAAADSVIEKRASLPYGFAHDCAQTVHIMAKHLNLSLDTDKDIAIRKIAGELDVDYSRAKDALERRARKAEQFHKNAEANILRKLASLCTETTDPELAPVFIMAVDEFDRSLSELQKQASAITKFAEDDFYMTPSESLTKKANQQMNIDGFNKIRRGNLSGINMLSISKWASDFGYDINSEDSPEQVVAVVGRMPKELRKEFVDIFA